MMRVVAVILAASAAADLYFLDGKYFHVVQAVAVTLRQHFLGW
jgi:hypothetical protein